MRPAKTAAKSKWIAYVDALEAAGGAGDLEAKLVELEEVAERQRVQINQLKRRLSNNG